MATNDTENGWLHLSPLSVVRFSVSTFWTFLTNGWPLLVSMFGSVAVLRQQELVSAGLGLASLFVLVFVLPGMLAYANFRYRIEPDLIRVRAGIFKRRETVARFDRIQALNWSEPLYYRLFGVVSLAFDSPGSSTDDIELHGIRIDRARALRRHVRSRMKTDHDVEHTDHPEILSLGTAGSLFVGFLKGNPLLQFVLFLILVQFYAPGVIANLDPGMVELLYNLLGSESAVAATVFSLLLIALFGFSTLAANLTGITRFFRLRLVDTGAGLRITRGLFYRREESLSLQKLQYIEYWSSPLSRLFGRAHLVIARFGRRARKAAFLVPGLQQYQLHSVIDRCLVVNREASVQGCCPSTWAYLFVWTLVFAVIAAGAILIGNRIALNLIPLAPFALFVLVYHRYLLANRCAMGLTPSAVWIRRGWWVRKLTLAELSKVQSVSLECNAIDRLCGTRSLKLALAGRSLQLPCVEKNVAEQIVEFILAPIQGQVEMASMEQGQSICAAAASS